jgi:hypothetical protein
LRNGLRKKNGKLSTYRGYIDVITIQRRDRVYLHVALIQMLTDANDRPIGGGDHAWVSFPFDLYTRFAKGDRIEFKAVASPYTRRDGTYDFGLDCPGEVCKAETPVTKTIGRPVAETMIGWLRRLLRRRTE